MQASEKRTARASALVIASSCCFGSISVLTTIVTRDGTPLVTAMFWRYALAALALAAFIGWRERERMTLSWPLLIAGGVGQMLVSYTSLRALDYIPVATLAFLFYTYPAWVAVYAAIRGIDRITPVRMVALAVALAGVATIIGSPFDTRFSVIGVTLALASAVAYGIYLPLMGSMQRRTTPMIAALHMTGGAAIVFGVMAVATGARLVPAGRASVAGVVTLALVCTAIAFWMILAGIDMLGPVRTAIIATVEPFYTTLLGAVVLGQVAGARTGIGGALIALAVIVIQRAARAEDARVVAPPAVEPV